MSRNKPLLVVGHRNPDTDSICAAISYARYKTEVAGVDAVACRAGSINRQTRFALDAFGADDPRLLADVLPRLTDIMIPLQDLLLVDSGSPLGEAHRIIVDRRFSFMPVVDKDGACVGRVTAVGLAALLDREGPPIRELLAMPVDRFLEPVGPTFPTSMPIRDAELTVNRSNEGGFIVTDERGAIAGIVTRMNFMTDSRFRVALVDHNESSQSVDGVEHAHIEEIVDHHRIGIGRTSSPITVINHVVGSTCTIVARMYREAGVSPPPRLAGLMLSGVLSDTVVLNSPTTTDVDRSTAEWLGGIAQLDPVEYGRAMFAAGSGIAELSADAIIGQDQKTYDERGRRFSVSQFEMVGFEGFWQRRAELAEALAAWRAAKDLYLSALMLTDITTSTTLLQISGPAVLLDRLAFPQPADGVFEMRGVLSRKKQVLPFLLELL